MPKRMTEAEAWREIARRIVKGEWKHGLCYEAWQVWGHGKISYATLGTMKYRIQEHLDEEDWAYPAGQEPESRALAALWMAHEAEEETTNA